MTQYYRPGRWEPPTRRSRSPQSELCEVLIILVDEVLYFVGLLIMVMSRISSGSIVSDYGLDDRAIGVRSPAGAKDFFL
jgi:hypothetical protein